MRGTANPQCSETRSQAPKRSGDWLKIMRFLQSNTSGVSGKGWLSTSCVLRMANGCPWVIGKCPFLQTEIYNAQRRALKQFPAGSRARFHLLRSWLAVGLSAPQRLDPEAPAIARSHSTDFKEPSTSSAAAFLPTFPQEEVRAGGCLAPFVYELC